MGWQRPTYWATQGMNPFSGEVPGMPCMDEIEENFKTYFWATKEGMTVHLSDDSWWPLDEDQNLKKDWSLNSS